MAKYRIVENDDQYTVWELSTSWLDTLFGERWNPISFPYGTIEQAEFFVQKRIEYSAEAVRRRKTYTTVKEIEG